MDKEEYKSTMKEAYSNLKYTLKRNATIAIMGLGMSYLLLQYNNSLINDLSTQLKENSMTNEEKVGLYFSTINKMQDIQNTAIGFGGASGLGLILGLGIPIAGYKKKKKLLEKEVN